jgi:hypothetical protein
MSGPRVWVEAWNPEYGSSFDLDEDLAASEEEVDADVEMKEWAPVSPQGSQWPRVAFVDGVSRVDARAFLDHRGATVPGIFGSVGIGSVCSDDGALFGPWEVKRAMVFTAGAILQAPSLMGGISYSARSVPGPHPQDARKGLEAFRAEIEIDLARRLAREGFLVVADGALGVREPLEVVGFIKSHHKSYAGPEHEPVVAALAAGQRTPLFAFGRVRPRYSWYLRLAPCEGQHPWAGVARCEVNAAISFEHARELADLLTFHLPRFASKEFWDSRAPQNLVPIASLERRLWHLLGDRDLIFRRIRSAFAPPDADV